MLAKLRRLYDHLVLNDTVTTGQVRNRPVVTFTNNDAAGVDLEVAIFIGG